MAVNDISDLVRAATVWIHGGPSDEASVHGTGFFIAPGIVVTCAHVLVEAGPNPHVRWRGPGAMDRSLQVKEQLKDPADAAVALAGMTYPDLALLQVDLAEHPLVPVGDPELDARVWCYGTTRQRLGPRHRPEPTAYFLTIQDAPPWGFIQLAGGSLKPGMSGGPVVDFQRKCVVGVIQSTLSEARPEGGYAVPIAAALDLAQAGDPPCFQGLRAQVAAIDRDSLDALCRDQAHLGNLPKLVAAKLPPDAAEDLQLQLVDRAKVSEELAPKPPGTPDHREWLARQLLRIELGDLVDVLTQAADMLDRSAIEVFELVATLLRTNQQADSQWVPAECVQDVHDELEAPRPRIVQVATDEVVSTRLLLRRALSAWVELKRVGGVSAATSVASIPTDVYEDIRALVRSIFAIDAQDGDWSQYPDEFAERMKTKVVVIDRGAVLDATVIRSLAERFPGMRIVLPRRDYVPPPGSASLLHVVTPPLDRGVERSALRMLAAFNDSLACRGLPPIQ